MSDLENIAAELSLMVSTGVWTFQGEMGAGKTTLIRALCKALGVEDQVTSPTFSLVNEYRMPGGSAVYHFDFYRIDDALEALDMGVEEYFESGQLCLVEWPMKIADYLPDNLGKIFIEAIGESRFIRVEPPI